MGDQAEYDLSRGYLVFVIGDTDPVPFRPKGWVGIMYPLIIEAVPHTDTERKAGVGLDAMKVDSVRRVCILWDPARWQATDYKSGINDLSQEVFRNASMALHLDNLVGV